MAETDDPNRPVHIDADEKYVRYEIDKKTGEVKIEPMNFNGVGCRAATERIENRLGSVTSRKDKDDEGGEAHQTVRSR